ncbi:clostripain-related cysteine peptidase [Pedobacter sp. MW01-1-1]|uniref:clostripain-related cysteine peptidase n=1 Tax=Pedobacter sp. MW01-1-1 TaxID=3383027 RepID=UPI003FEE4730
MKVNRIPIFAIFLIGFTFFGCKKEPIEKPLVLSERTVLMYLAANNNLREDAVNSINKMEKGAQKLNGNLIVFVKTSSNKSVLLKIKYDNTDQIVSDTVMIYGSENSSDPQFLAQVIKDSRRMYPAKSYGLVMWSHATSWSPPTIKVKSFGSDRNYEMDIKDFKNALPSDFEYILFDACSMGSIEVVYELKDKAKYLLVSPSEVLSTSFPYDLITPFFFGDEEDLKNICRDFIAFYSSQTGESASATVSLIKTNELELLVQYTKRLLNSTTLSKPIDLSNIQRLDFASTSPVPAYDFIDFLQKNYSQQDYQIVEDQLNKTVIFKGQTDYFFEQPIKKFCGLSVYLQNKDTSFSDYYRSLTWYNRSGWNILF